MLDIRTIILLKLDGLGTRVYITLKLMEEKFLSKLYLRVLKVLRFNNIVLFIRVTTNKI